MKYIVRINDRKYTEWSVLDSTTLQEPEKAVEIDPIAMKIFSGDVVSVECTDEETCKIDHSPVREQQCIAGVLDLKSNKTYGRDKSNGKMLYRVLPDDTRLPVFLVPYEVKHLGFSKVMVNQYITFKYDSWTSKHPVARMTSVIGNVDTLQNFYEYQLYCKSLHSSIQTFNKVTSKRVREFSQDHCMDHILEKYAGIEDRRGDAWSVFTIDPTNSTDFDDGFSLVKREEGWTLSIYISNVSIILDALGLWDSFSRRVSTIYLPDRKRPMLPTILSDSLCSLQEKTTSFAFAMDIELDKDYDVVSVGYKNCAIRVSRNYRYEEKDLLKHKDYKRLHDIVCAMSSKKSYISSIDDSHDVVSYLMTFMNYRCATFLLEKNVGIFRNSAFKSDAPALPENIDPDVEKFVKMWYSSGGQYVNVENIKTDPQKSVRHELMNMDAYIHITSPIRRLVDLLNMIKIQEVTGMITFSEKSAQFYDFWTSEKEMEFVNTTMRSIKRVQTDCSMLEFYTTNGDKVERDYTGVVFDRLHKQDGMVQYTVYLPEIKLTGRIFTQTHLENFTNHMFRIYLFHDEDTLKRKVRLNMVTSCNN